MTMTMYSSCRALVALTLLAAAHGQVFEKIDGQTVGPNYGAMTVSTLEVDADIEICALSVRIDVTHTYNSDLMVELELSNDMGMKATMIVGQGNTCGGADHIRETFVDGGTGDSCEPNGDPVAPIEPLSTFNHYNVGGTWTLTTTDTYDFDGGTLDSWALIVTPCNGQAMGDPHFQTWSGEWYDFHGQCDLVYLDNPEFDNEAGLSIHIRTAPRYEYSYIEAAAVKIGEDVLVVQSWGDYFFNDVQAVEMPLQIGGYTATHESVSDKKHVYNIDIGHNMHIVLSTFKDMVSVKMVGAKYEHFKDSVGLLGKFGTGEHLARDGTTIMADVNDFGLEWQVQETEPLLFPTAAYPQHPVQCVMPRTEKAKSRRLGQSIAEQAANAACSHWGDMKEQCVFDVMVTGDLELAAAGAL